MQKFSGKVTDTSGNPVANARLSVYQANILSPLPIVYKPNGDNTLGTLSNPFLTGSDGQYAFVVGSGEYEIRATGSSAVLNISKTITDFTPAALAPVVPVTLNRQLFAGTSTWTAPAGVIQATITCVGAGGGGGGGSTNSGGAAGGGGGGGGGAVIRRTLPVNPGTAYSIVAGVGGAGSAAGTAGVAGGNTSFGSLVTANGGSGGGSSTGTAGGASGSGGSGTLVGFGGGVTQVFTTTPIVLLYGSGAAIAGSSGGAGGAGGTGATGANATSVETFAGGIGGAGDTASRGGGGGGGSTAFGSGGSGGVYGGAAATSPNVNNWGGGGGGGAALAVGAGGGDGLCIVEWIS